MALIATVGAADANSYVTLAEANAYHTVRLHNTEWTTATDVTKEAALQWATLLLDAKYSWVGYKVTDTQALDWPRNSAYDGKDLIDYNVIPDRVKNATSELAFHLIVEDRTLTDEPDSSGLSSFRVGPIGLSFDKTDRKDMIPSSVYDFIKPLITNLASMVRIDRA